MFGKKETPKNTAPIRITILTDEYIIEAQDDPDLTILQAAYDSEIQEPTGGTIILKDVYVKPLGGIQTPSRTFTEWRMPSLVKVIAILSDDPQAEDLLADAWYEYTTPFKAEIYAGTFKITGTIYSEDEDPPAFALRTFVPIDDAIITHQKGDQAAPIRSRWGVVNSVLMHGFSAEKG